MRAADSGPLPGGTAAPGGDRGSGDGKTFHLSWPPWQPPAADGLAAIVAPGASTAWADGLLARDRDGLVVWAATGSEPEAQALARLQYPGVRAVTLTPAKSDPRWVRLGLEVATRLAASRHARTTGPVTGHTACLTGRSLPTPPPDVVRIPHLITVQRDGVVSDDVMWELTTLAGAQHWLGGPLPDQSFFETRLDSLLHLRSAARRGRLPATAVAAGLAELLRGRELSIRLVYEHATTFQALLSG